MKLKNFEISGEIELSGTFVHRLVGRKTENENCSADCTDFAGPDLRGVWAEPVSKIPSDANAAGNYQPISNCALRIPVRARGRRGAGHWWLTVLWFILFLRYQQNFSGLFAARPA